MTLEEQIAKVAHWEIDRSASLHLDIISDRIAAAVVGLLRQGPTMWWCGEARKVGSDHLSNNEQADTVGQCYVWWEDGDGADIHPLRGRCGFIPVVLLDEEGSDA